MGLFASKKQEARDAEAAGAPDEREAAAQARRNREDAWRRDRNAVMARLRSAETMHAEAKRTYDRYAPGPQKDAAGEALNAAVDHLAAVEREFAAVDHFSTWNANH